MVGHLVQKAGFPCFRDYLTCSICSNKVDELGAHKGKVSLYICLVETLVIYVLAEGKLQYPALIITERIITEISRFQIHIQIRFEHNNTEDTAVILILTAREVLVLLKACYIISFFNRGFPGRFVCIKKTAALDTGFFLEYRVSNPFEDSAMGKHVVVANLGIIPLNGREEMEVRAGGKPLSAIMMPFRISLFRMKER